MSTARGANVRKRPQKHQNEFAWSSTKNKTDPKTKLIQSVVVDNCCERCTGVIQWRINYGKYKPLARPAKCVKCSERKIKQAYHTLCCDCSNGLCAKCGEELKEEDDSRHSDEDLSESKEEEELPSPDHHPLK